MSVMGRRAAYRNINGALVQVQELSVCRTQTATGTNLGDEALHGDVIVAFQMHCNRAMWVAGMLHTAQPCELQACCAAILVTNDFTCMRMYVSMCVIFMFLCLYNKTRCVCSHLFAYVCMYVCVYVCMYVCNIYQNLYINMNTYVRNIHKCSCLCMYTYIYVSRGVIRFNQATYKHLRHISKATSYAYAYVHAYMMAHLLCITQPFWMQATYACRHAFMSGGLFRSATFHRLQSRYIW